MEDPRHQPGGLAGDRLLPGGRAAGEPPHHARVVTFGGQSLQGPPESFPLLRLSPSGVNHFPDGLRVSAAVRCQGLALRFGKGRVVVLGEAAMLTSQPEGGGKLGFTVPDYDDRRST